MDVLGTFGEFALRRDPRSAAGLALMWPSTWLYLVAMIVPTTFGLLYFPTGRLPSRRWRALVWIAWVGLACLVASHWFIDWLNNAEFGYRLPAQNPFYLRGAQVPSRLLFTVGAALAIPSVVGALASLIVRYHCSRGDERQQMRLTVFGVVVAAVLYFTGDLYDEMVGRDVIAAVVFSSFPLTVGVAILKYRLYDIDVVISKTVVFAGLAAFITGIYVAIVVGVGSLLGAGGEPNLALSIVATALVAVAFQPVRERLTKLANRLVFGQRATPYEVLSRFSSHLGETVATEQTLGQMVRLLAEGTGAARAQVWLQAGGQMRTAASWPADAAPDFLPVVHSDGSLPAFAEVDVAVAICHRDQLLGALTVTKKRGEAITPTEQRLVEQLATQAGLVLKNVQLTADLRARLDELRDSRRRLVAAQDAERRRLERDVHDGAQQQLVALTVKLGIAKTLAEREDAPRTAALVEQVAADAGDAVTTLRELAHGIYPPLLAAEGLTVALQGQARKAAIPVEVIADGVGRYPQEVEAAVYFCVLEALNNTAKYAKATKAIVTLAQINGELTFQVVDDGVGFDPMATPRGHGLTNMSDRLHALDGTVAVTSQPGRGTTVAGSIPVAPRTDPSVVAS